MSRLDDLPPDQRATLSLLLRNRKSYADVAQLLDIAPRAVHDRAHAALAVLAPRQARGLPAESREQVGDYLLGQRAGVAERLATRSYLESSPEARAWATALGAELAPLANTPLPEIPGDSRPAPSSAPATVPSSPHPPAPRDLDSSSTAAAAPKRSLPSPGGSRTGGALLLAAIVAVIVVAVVLIANGGGGSSSNSTSSGAAAEAQSTGSSTATTSTSGAKAKEDKRISLRPPNASSRAAGVAEVLSEGSQYAFYLAAEDLPPSKGKGFFYAVWLYNSPSSHEALGRSPEVSAKGSLQGGALLPKDAGKYHTMLLTRETSTRPTSPGPVVLRGSFALH
ncbi:MAG: RNA polymerase sigma factor [Solirubrobacteraceae bacterium]